MMPFWFFMLIIKNSLCFTLLHKTCGMTLTAGKKKFVIFLLKLRKSFFCVLKKMQKHVIVCNYYCVTTK